MCFFSKPKVAAPPPPPPVPTPPPQAPRQADPATKAERAREKKQLATQQGRKSTILTGPRGDLSEADVSKKTLLGNQIMYLFKSSNSAREAVKRAVDDINRKEVAYKLEPNPNKTKKAPRIATRGVVKPGY